MATASASELCTLLVNDVYGEVSSKVVSILLETGRLPLTQLSRHAKLPEKTVKQTLVVLIQQHLVLHFTHLEGGREETYYECDWAQAYELLHVGRIIRTMEDRFGNDGATIASNLLQLGHARVSDFLLAYGVSTTKGKRAKQAKSSDPTFEDATPISSVETLKAAMGDMMKARFLTVIKEYHVHSRTDIINGLRADLTKRLRDQFTSEIKLTKEVESQLKKRVHELRDSDTSEHAGLKRRIITTNGRGKRKKKVSIYDEEEEEIEWEIDEDAVVRLNHEKFLVLFRNVELIHLAEKRLGKVTAQVYAEFLKHMESKVHRCRTSERENDGEDDDSPQNRNKISCLELVRNFDSAISLEDSIIVLDEKTKGQWLGKRPYDNLDEGEDNGPRKRNGVMNGRKKGTRLSDIEEEDELSDEGDESGEDEDMGFEARQRRKRMTLVKQHLELLTQDSCRFLTSESNRGGGEWSVDYKELGKTLRAIELEKIVEERFESTGTRLLRIIKDKGKLDEKQIANIALLKQNEIRAILSGLHEAGHLELQEVPKSMPPQVSRTFFLWHFDEERAYKVLLSDVYKAMCRNIQRTLVEKTKRKHLIEKSERTDVQANYEEFLTKSEKAELDTWRHREERLLVQLVKMDRVVMILRDF